MPVARSASASQLSREVPASAGTTPTSDAAGPPMLHMKAHTLDRFSKPGLINGRNETTRRKRSFMSFRLNKKGAKRKEGEGIISESSSTNNNNSNGNSHSGDSQDGSDSSSAASVKPKRRHLNRVGSFVRKVASRVQVAGPVLASVIPPPPPRPKTAPSLVQAEEKVPNSNAVQNSSTTELIKSVAEPPPLLVQDYIPFDEKQVPAVIGLRNHGNTCFINAIVQCLNHTDVLAEYFVLDAYKQDLRRCNRIGNRKMNNGSRRGEMTEQVAGVLKSLWSLRYVPDVSLALKACVDRHEAAYRGSSQHDAAEFLMFLLGKVHDDLNTASKRKYKKIKVMICAVVTLVTECQRPQHRQQEEVQED
ncbi:Peptidase C19 ubiquitin carboxyl-terminal hydrolase [Trinorchestia longiramus]|nr:Peptidase C19 ubiquitin carboxyl-terminal hydrolase [Trinorchestia longiramus]